MPETPIRVGVLGVGSLGQHHARVYAELLSCSLAGVYDTDAARTREVAARHGCRVFDTAEALLREVDAVSVAVPTVDHHAMAGAALAAGVDVLVEKPMTATLAEADALIAQAEAGGRILQVGHVERFNPVVDVLKTHGAAPRFIEAHRLGAFPGRSLDIDVILDLMVHDLDIVLALDGTEPVQVDAVGVPVLTPRLDIASARLRFASGLIANLTASRVSLEKVRKFRVFAPGIYVSADLLRREAQVVHIDSSDPANPKIDASTLSAPDEEPLKRQLESFLEAVRTREQPLVPGSAGRRALDLADRILASIEAQGPSRAS